MTSQKFGQTGLHSVTPCVTIYQVNGHDEMKGNLINYMCKYVKKEIQNILL